MLTFGAASRTTTRWPRWPSVRAAAMPPMPVTIRELLRSRPILHTSSTYRPWSMLAHQLSIFRCITYPTTMTSRGTFARGDSMVSRPGVVHRMANCKRETRKDEQRSEEFGLQRSVAIPEKIRVELSEGLPSHPCQRCNYSSVYEQEELPSAFISTTSDRRPSSPQIVEAIASRFDGLSILSSSGWSSLPSLILPCCAFSGAI